MERARSAEGPLTIEEFERLPDEESRMDLVRGVVVREPPAGFEHGRMDVRIAYQLHGFVEEHGLGMVVGAETGFVLQRDPPTVRAPDAAFVAEARIPSERVEGYFPGPPDLAVEVVSPSNRAGEIQDKVEDYLSAGTRLVWVIYPERRTVAVHASLAEARFLRDGDVLDGGDVLPGLRLEVGELFG